MNEKHLRIYLDDHLALMVAEIELIGRCLRSNRASPLGQLLEQLETEVSAQKSMVQDIFQRIGGKEGIESTAKQNAAWLAEKLGRLKLNGSFLSYSNLSRVIELETLTVAAQGRVGLWDNLEAVASEDKRCKGIPFSTIREQSQRHLDELNTHRKVAAKEAFSD